MDWRIASALLLIVGIAVGYAAASLMAAGEPVEVHTITATLTTTVTETPATLTVTATATETVPLEVRVVSDALGREVEVMGTFNRIVSLAPSITEHLCVLGVCDLIVAADEYSLQVEGVPENVTVVGGFWTPSLEAVLAARPDLVLICSGVPAQEAMVQQLEDAGVTVFALRCDRARDVKDVLWDISALGALLGRSEAAEKLARSIEASIAEVKARLSEANATPTSLALIVYLDEKGAWVAGGGTFQNDIVNLAGGQNVFADLYGWQMVGFEHLAAKDPDLVVVTGMGPEDLNRTLSILAKTPLAESRAYREGRVCLLYGEAANVLSRPGPRIADAVRILAGLLHPGVVQVPEQYSSYILCGG
ncbi:MAG: helical backbone metal receptor [Thermoproteota archaeon]